MVASHLMKGQMNREPESGCGAQAGLALYPVHHAAPPSPRSTISDIATPQPARPLMGRVCVCMCVCMCVHVRVGPPTGTVHENAFLALGSGVVLHSLYMSNIHFMYVAFFYMV